MGSTSSMYEITVGRDGSVVMVIHGAGWAREEEWRMEGAGWVSV
jgi:hypothetical protein